jgi:hypothetical protein
MAHITIQLDADTLRILKSEASKNHLSVSKWIKKHVLRGLKQKWPEDYFSLFGSLAEDDLVEPQEIPFKYETTKESL